MSLFAVGRLCLKIAGRDAGNKCVVVEDLSNGYVLIDGNVRRKKVNVKHLEPLAETIEVSSGSHADVKKAFEKLELTVWERKSKKPAERPKKQKKKSEKPVKEKKEEKVEEKKEKKEEKKEEPTVPPPTAHPQTEATVEKPVVKEVKEENKE